jgi:hypothetical protein
VFPPSKVGENSGTLFDRCSTRGSPSSARASAPLSPLINGAIEFATKLANVGYRQVVVSAIEAKLIGAVKTRPATSDIAHLKMERPPKVCRGRPFRFISCFLSLPQNEVAKCTPR